MAEILQRLDRLQRIVDEHGIPTQYFIRFIQDRGGAVTDLDALITALQALEVIAGVSLDGGGPLTGDVTIDHADSAVTPGTYGDATNVAQFTVDQQGHVTDVVEVAIAGANGQRFTGGVVGSMAVASGAHATRGVHFTPDVDMDLTAICAILAPTVASHQFYAQVSTVNAATGQVTTVLATTGTVTAVGVGTTGYTMTFASPVALTAGTDYLLSVTFSQASGTAVLRQMFTSQGCMVLAPYRTPALQSRNYATVGLTDGQAVSSSTAVSDIYAIFPEVLV
jgi:hypothetical protein